MCRPPKNSRNRPWMRVCVGVQAQAATQTDEVILATQCHKWQITEGVCEYVHVDTLVQGEWMTLRESNRQEEERKERGLEMVMVSLFCAQGRAGHYCDHFLRAFPVLTHTHLHGALTLQHNEQGLARHRRTKVFPVTWAAASTQRCSSGTRPTWVCRADFTPPPLIRLH